MVLEPPRYSKGLNADNATVGVQEAIDGAVGRQGKGRRHRSPEEGGRLLSHGGPSAWFCVCMCMCMCVWRAVLAAVLVYLYLCLRLRLCTRQEPKINLHHFLKPTVFRLTGDLCLCLV